ncbi:AAA family ATPase [Corynebacterium sp. H113]|uniref:AAA family ATPase n=1 Tax=Corynebacterium sp. H113 TaxID=3133419 RepID=UPI00309FDD5F
MPMSQMKIKTPSPSSSIEDSTVQNSSRETSQEYYKAGWQLTIPLPYGHKSPPPRGITGRGISVETRMSNAAEAWNNSTVDANLAILMLTPDSVEYSVLGLDVDHYGDKHGGEDLAALETELGSLNLATVPRSTRRGLDSKSATYFFKVPTGLEWRWPSGSSPDIDIIQSGHRYSVVWPSVVDGMEYRWYLGVNEIEIPHQDTLPELPTTWVSYLSTEERDRAPKAEIQGYEAAIDWLAERVLPGAPVTLEIDWGGCRHDIMTAKVLSLVNEAVSLGRPGLIGSLAEVQSQFVAELSATNDQNRAYEFEAAVVSAVSRVKGEIDSGDRPHVNWLALERRLGLASRPEALAFPTEIHLPVTQNAPVVPGKLSFVRGSKIKTKIPEFAWEIEGNGVVPLGGMTLITGKGGDGKSTLCRWLGAQITRGSLPGCWQGTPHNVLYIAAEEAAEYAVNPSFRVNGADMDRVLYVRKGSELNHFSPSQDMADLIELCLSNDVKAVFVDPVTNFLEGKDGNNGTAVREALRPWTRLAEEIDGAVIAIAHQKKSAGGDIVSGVSGSGEFGNVIRSLLGTATDHETGQRVLSHGKSNLGKRAPSYSYDLTEQRISADDGKEGTVMKFTLGEQSDTGADEIQIRNTQHATGERQTAKSWLRELLTREKALLKSDIVSRAAGKFSESSLEKAKRDLRVKKVTTNGQAVWTLPNT